MIVIKIPKNILKDLVLRSKENGATVELELAKRLARTLEQDLAMIAEDNEFALQAFERVTRAVQK